MSTVVRKRSLLRREKPLKIAKECVMKRANESGFLVHHDEKTQELGGWDLVAVDHRPDARIQR